MDMALNLTLIQCDLNFEDLDMVSWVCVRVFRVSFLVFELNLVILNGTAFTAVQGELCSPNKCTSHRQTRFIWKSGITCSPASFRVRKYAPWDIDFCSTWAFPLEMSEWIWPWSLQLIRYWLRFKDLDKVRCVYIFVLEFGFRFSITIIKWAR